MVGGGVEGELVERAVDLLEAEDSGVEGGRLEGEDFGEEDSAEEAEEVVHRRLVR